MNLWSDGRLPQKFEVFWITRKGVLNNEKKSQPNLVPQKPFALDEVHTTIIDKPEKEKRYILCLATDHEMDQIGFTSTKLTRIRKGNFKSRYGIPRGIPLEGI